MNNKGQMTLFMIIGIAIVIIAGIVYYILTPELDVGLDVPDEIKPVANYVQECIEQKGEPAIRLIAAQGGNIVPASSLFIEGAPVSYGYSAGANTLVALADMETQLSAYMELAVQDCIKFDDFPGFGIRETGSLKVAAEIFPEKVVFSVDYPLEISVGESTTTLDRFRHEEGLPLGKAYSIARDVIVMIVADPEYIDMTAIGDIALSVDVAPVDSENVVWKITHELTELVFMFGAKYDLNKAPVLDMEDEYVLDDGQLFTLQVQATDADNDPLIFSDDSAMFEISESGLISFTPELPGEYEVRIMVEDDHDNYDSKIVVFEVR